MRRVALCLLLFVLAVGCERPTTVEEFYSRPVRLPNGKQVLVEVMIRPADMARGMMFRDSLAPDRGMLFLHNRPGKYTYWMYQVKIPLDILWMDSGKTIVEISANTPPCQTAASQCQQYGGNAEALYVLELGGGMAAKYGLKVGSTLTF